MASGQYRNAVASGQPVSDISKIVMSHVDPTLPRYGTDPRSTREHNSCTLGHYRNIAKSVDKRSS